MEQHKKVLIVTLIIAVLSVIFSVMSVHAQSLGYVQNPSSSYLKDFDGSARARIDDNAAPRTGYFFLDVGIANNECDGGGLTNTDSSIFLTSGAKGAINCTGNVKINVRASVDNQNYYLTQFAKIGDYDTINKHTSVVPYHYNTWINTKYSVKNNENVCRTLLSEGVKKNTLGTFGYPDSYIDCAPSAIQVAYDFGYKQGGLLGEGVCSANIVSPLILANQNNYYTHPDYLNVPGYGRIAGYADCVSLMKPSGSTNYPDSLYREHPEILYSLLYDPEIQYTAYPFSIKSIEFSCYDSQGKVLSKDSSRKNTIQFFEDPYSGGLGTLQTYKNPAGNQYYPWSRYGSYSIATLETETQHIIGELGLALPTNGVKFNVGGSVESNAAQYYYELNKEEVIDQKATFSCAPGSQYYQVAVTLQKNELYRHISPLDFTYRFDDIFNITTSSRIYNSIQNTVPLAPQNTMYYTYKMTGGFNIANVSPNTAVGQNDMLNPVSENNSMNEGITSTTPSDCFGCQNTNIGGVVLNPNGAGAGTGVGTSGGTDIGNGVDTSATNNLMIYATNQKRIDSKENFMSKLMELGTIVMSVIIIIYGLVALGAILFTWIYIFMMPEKMKAAIKELFSAGSGK